GVSTANSVSSFLTFIRINISFGRRTPVEVPTERSLSFMVSRLYIHINYNARSNQPGDATRRLHRLEFTRHVARCAGLPQTVQCKIRWRNESQLRSSEA